LVLPGDEFSRVVIDADFDHGRGFPVPVTGKGDKSPSRRCRIPGKDPKTWQALRGRLSLLRQKPGEGVLAINRHPDAPGSRDGQARRQTHTPEKPGRPGAWRLGGKETQYGSGGSLVSGQEKKGPALLPEDQHILAANAPASGLDREEIEPKTVISIHV
jgi:hypothetical protein